MVVKTWLTGSQRLLKRAKEEPKQPTKPASKKPEGVNQEQHADEVESPEVARCEELPLPDVLDDTEILLERNASSPASSHELPSPQSLIPVGPNHIASEPSPRVMQPNAQAFRQSSESPRSRHPSWISKRIVEPRSARRDSVEIVDAETWKKGRDRDFASLQPGNKVTSMALHILLKHFAHSQDIVVSCWHIDDEGKQSVSAAIADIKKNFSLKYTKAIVQVFLATDHWTALYLDLENGAANLFSSLRGFGRPNAIHSFVQELTKYNILETHAVDVDGDDFVR